MDPTRFDDVTKALATSTSRRQALRRIGGTLTGVVLASLLPGRALASPKTCHSFCLSVFGAGTSGAKQCITDASQHTGLCYTCGPASPSGTQPICCPQDASGHCTSYSSATCCGSEQFCFQGDCFFSCFTAGTRIAMADGTSRPIEHVLVGDLVLGRTGRFNRVVEIERPVLGSRHLYALNESSFFVTAEHPFLTEAGWKSIDPSALAAENSALPVGRLTVGDRLLTLAAVAVPMGVGRSISAEAVDVRLDAVPLRSLIGRPADPATPLYNLRLDGDHAYFANDLLVHNKV